ncbi:MAG: TetR/AcrR family transcriptional regulator, partial [Gaiellaceae bacterium]
MGLPGEDIPQPVTESREVERQPRPRGRPRRASAGEAILEATLGLLAERGFQATTIEAIADRAGVGRNTIYRRWSSKEELIADALGDLTAELDVQEDGEIYAQLLARISDFVHVFAHPLLGRLLPGLLGELERNPAFASAYVERIVTPRYERIVELLGRAVARGELDEQADPEVIADLLVGPPLLRLRFPFGLPELPEDYP